MGNKRNKEINMEFKKILNKVKDLGTLELFTLEDTIRKEFIRRRNKLLLDSKKHGIEG